MSKRASQSFGLAVAAVTIESMPPAGELFF